MPVMPMAIRLSEGCSAASVSHIIYSSCTPTSDLTTDDTGRIIEYRQKPHEHVDGDITPASNLHYISYFRTWCVASYTFHVCCCYNETSTMCSYYVIITALFNAS